MSNNKTINQFPTDVVLTGTEYILGMSEGVTIKLVLDSIKNFILSGATSGSTGVQITGGTYDNSTGELSLVDSTGGTVTVSGFYTGGTFVETISDNGNAAVYVDNTDPLNPIIVFTGVTTDGSTIVGTGLDGDPLSISPDYSSVSDLGFVITPKITAIITRDVLLPRDSFVSYPSPLAIATGFRITVPTTTTLTIT
jgi:hypothetical protein